MALRDQFWDWQQPYLNIRSFLWTTAGALVSWDDREQNNPGNTISTSALSHQSTDFYGNTCSSCGFPIFPLALSVSYWHPPPSFYSVPWCSRGVRLDSGKQVSQSIVSMLSSSWGATDLEIHSAFLLFLAAHADKLFLFPSLPDCLSVVSSHMAFKRLVLSNPVWLWILARCFWSLWLSRWITHVHRTISGLSPFHGFAF